ncbi:NACHT domain-containing protein [Pedobacter sp.]
MAVISALAFSIITQIFSGEGFISAFVKTSNATFQTGFATHKSDIRDYIISMVVMIVVYKFIMGIFNNWDGPVSKNTYDKRRFNQPSTLLDEAKIQAKAIFNNKKIIKYKPELDTSVNSVFANTDPDKLPWHIHVFELLTFSSGQYRFDREKDYHEKENCYIGPYGNSNNYQIAVLCLREIPNKHKLRDFITFARKINKNVHEFKLAVKSRSDQDTFIEINDIRITIIDEKEMLDQLINFQSYFNLIEQRYCKAKVTEGDPHTLQDIYVPIRGTDMQGQEVGKLEDFITAWSKEQSDNRHLAVLGEYGCGKSVLSLKFAHKLIGNVAKGGRIPILIELRGKSPRNLSRSEIFSTWAQDYHINSAALMKLHKAGKLVLILEGFDEMDMVGDKDMRLEHFQRLWEFAMPNTKIMITGRPNFFLDDAELRTNLGIEKRYDGSPYCQALYLEKFNKTEIEFAMRNIDDSTRKQVLEILNNARNTNFYDLVSRPAILYLVTVIWKARRLSELRNKINSATIISEFIKYSYSRQTGKKNNFPLSEMEREYFMNGIAVAMVERTGYTNQINKIDLNHIILELYKHIPDEVSTITSVHENRRNPLRSRLLDNRAEETIMTDIRSCGIIVNDITRRDYFKFAHKSFLEYQASLYYAESLLQDRQLGNLIMNAISKSLNVSINTFSHSEETRAFTSEILIDKLNIDELDNGENAAKKLYAILYPIKILKSTPKLAALSEIVLGSFIMALIIICLTVYSSYFMQFEVKEKRNQIIQILWTSSLFLPMVWALVNVKIRRANKLLKIWFQACCQLKISRKTLRCLIPNNYYRYLNSGSNRSYHRFALTRLLIWLNHRKARRQKVSKLAGQS